MELRKYNEHAHKAYWDWNTIQDPVQSLKTEDYSFNKLDQLKHYYSARYKRKRKREGEEGEGARKRKQRERK
jgi:hypothetical protein